MCEFPKTIESLGRGIDDGLHLGAQIAVFKDGRSILDRAMGENRPGAPLGSDMMMPWLSCGKPVTAVAILQQVQRDRLELETRVAEIIPEFARGGKESLTAWHLLTHTGGFRESDKFSEHLGREATIERICSAPMEPGWRPGGMAAYQIRGSWFLLGEIIRRVDGRPVEQYVREEVFEPAGMMNSWMAIPPDMPGQWHVRIGCLHLTSEGEPVLHPFLNRERCWQRACPGSSCRGPVSDLARFYDHLLQVLRGRAHGVLNGRVLRQMMGRQRAGLFDQTFQHVIDWGLGVIVNSARHGRETVPYGFGRHAGDTAFGHGGMQSSMAFADPEHGLAVAWVCNGMPGEPKHQDRARTINTAIYEDLGLD